MSPTGPTIAVLFADIAGSTRLYEKLGDAKALATISRCLELACDAGAEFGGRLVKMIGDEAMLVFPAADQAAAAAAEIQGRMSELAAVGDQRLAFRMGLPGQLHDPDVLFLALHGHQVERAQVPAHAGRQRLGGGRRQDDLTALRQRNHPRRDVDRIAEHVAIAFDRLAEMQAHAKGESVLVDGRQLAHPALDFRGGRGSLIGRRKDEHRLVADHLDQSSAEFRAGVAGKIETATDRRQRFRVAQFLVETSASGNVGEQHGNSLTGGTHCVCSARMTQCTLCTRRSMPTAPAPDAGGRRARQHCASDQRRRQFFGGERALHGGPRSTRCR